jgi:general secretion pathway protein L
MRQGLTRAREQIATFLRWWWSELAAALQDGLSSVAPRWRRPLTVRIAPDRVVVTDSAADSNTIAIEFERVPNNAPLPTVLPDIVGRSIEAGRRVTVLISAHYGFVNRLSLPLAAKPHLASAVALQLPKLLPMDPAALLSDYRVTRTDVDRARLDIEVAALRRSDVEPLLVVIRGWGLRIADLQLEPTPREQTRFQFATGTGDGRLASISRRDRMLLGAAVCLGLACAATAVAQGYRADRALAQAQERTTTEASAALAARLQLNARLAPLQSLSEIERSERTAAILSELSLLIPLDTWLTTFELKGRQIRLVGLSPDTSGLVKRLASANQLADVELRSSMSAGIGTGKDRFEVSATVASPKP